MYFFNQGLLFSLDLQDEQAELQQHQSPSPLCLSEYMYCFNNPYLYFINLEFIYEIDCTDISNIEIKSKESLEGCDDIHYNPKDNQGVFLNGKIYFLDSRYFYQVEIETRAMKKILLDDVIPFDNFATRKFYITSENELRFFGSAELYKKDKKTFFMEITFDNEFSKDHIQSTND